MMLAPNALLLGDELLADGRHDRDGRCGFGHFAAAKQMADRFIIQPNTRRVLAPVEIDPAIFGDERQLARIIQRGASPQRLQGDGSIHRAGIEKIKAKPLRDRLRDARFSSSSRSVNGDDHWSRIRHIAGTSSGRPDASSA